MKVLSPYLVFSDSNLAGVWGHLLQTLEGVSLDSSLSLHQHGWLQIFCGTCLKQSNYCLKFFYFLPPPLFFKLKIRLSWGLLSSDIGALGYQLLVSKSSTYKVEENPGNLFLFLKFCGPQSHCLLFYTFQSLVMFVQYIISRVLFIFRHE